MADFDTTRKRETVIGMGAGTSTGALHFSEKSGLLLPFVASIFRSGMSSRISSLMSASLGFFGRAMLNPPLNVFSSLNLNVANKRICDLPLFYSKSLTISSQKHLCG